MRRGWPARLVIMMICKSQRFAILIILLCILSAIAILLIFAKLYCSAEQDHISTPEGKADHQVMSTSTAPMRLNIDSNEITVLDKFSVIIPTYRRVILLKRVLSNLCDLESLVDCIIVVWNNIAEPIPDDLLQFNCKVRLYFKKEATNSLNNRFIHYSEIRTEGMYIINLFSFPLMYNSLRDISCPCTYMHVLYNLCTLCNYTVLIFMSIIRL